jgi:branched-chain amino acid transport system permease protein
MRALGYATVPYKLAAFCISGAVAGYAGALFVQHDRFVSPTNVSFEISALALIMVIIGGTGTLYGPVLGAGVVVLLRDELSTRFAERWELLLGLVFIAVVYFLPRGVAGFAREVAMRVGRGMAPSPGPSPNAGAGEIDSPGTEAVKR